MRERQHEREEEEGWESDQEKQIGPLNEEPILFFKAEDTGKDSM